MKSNKSTKLLINNLLKLIYNISAVLTPIYVNTDYTVRYPYFPILMFLLTTSSISLYLRANLSKEELKVDTFFLFLNPFLIGITCNLFKNQPFNLKLITMNAMNSGLILALYLFFRKPFLELYEIIGKWAIIAYIMMFISILVTTLTQMNMFVGILIALIIFVGFCYIPFLFNKQKK